MTPVTDRQETVIGLAMKRAVGIRARLARGARRWTGIALVDVSTAHLRLRRRGQAVLGNHCLPPRTIVLVAMLATIAKKRPRCVDAPSFCEVAVAGTKIILALVDIFAFCAYLAVTDGRALAFKRPVQIHARGLLGSQLTVRRFAPLHSVAE